MWGKLLGIDHGQKHIGLAVSDATGLVARELAIIRWASDAEAFRRINQLAAEQQVIGFVVGLPSNEVRPGAHSQADTVREWVERLGRTSALPIILWDEQLTSADAQEIARQKRRKRGEPIDDLAARVILQSYLDAVHDGLASPPQPRR